MQIHILGSLVITLLTISIFTFLSFVYWQNIRSIKSYQKYILFAFRCTALLFMIFLILDPWFQWKKKIKIREKISIYLDSSVSMQNQLAFDEIKISQLKSKIDNWLEKNNVDSQWYLFGENIREASIREFDTFSDSVTDFTALPNHAIINSGRELILITDGQSNRNIDIKHLDFDEGLKVNVIGVGSDQKLNDLWIENITVPSYIYIEDSVKIQLTIGYEVFEDVDGKLIFNFMHKDDYSIPIEIPSGEGFIDIEKTFLATEIDDLNKIDLHSEIVESNFENNSDFIHIEVNKQKKGVLLVSSGPSPNTPLIKSLLADLPSHDLLHLYRKQGSEWSLNLSNIMNDSSVDLILFEDFPGNMKDIQIYQRISGNSLWENSAQIYIEGPKSNASTGEILSKKLDTSLRITDNINNLKIDYFNESFIFKHVNLSSIPPTKKRMVWESKPNNKIYGFDDNSAAIVKLNNFYGVFIQDAQQIILNESRNHQSELKKIFSNLFFYAFTGNENLLKVTAEKEEYMANSPIIFNIEKSLFVDNGLASIHINDSNGKSIKEILLLGMESKSSPQFIALPGIYTAIASLDIKDAERIESKPFYFRVIKNSLEDENLFENKNNLEKLAWGNGGTYSDPKNIEIILSMLNSRPKSQLKEYKLSALSTQRYWWLLIVLLSIEWFLRKREGLL